MNTEKTIIVILGLGENEKPRAARFNPDDVETATKAASLSQIALRGWRTSVR
jgi:hypothetical protein